MDGCLVLSRKVGERVRIRTKAGEVITVTLAEIDRGKAKLVFQADTAIAIDREEVVAAKDAAAALEATA
jgi:carbon storage regulator CsrA